MNLKDNIYSDVTLPQLSFQSLEELQYLVHLMSWVEQITTNRHMRQRACHLISVHSYVKGVLHWGSVINPASMKQALMSSARRLPGVSIFEQGDIFEQIEKLFVVWLCNTANRLFQKTIFAKVVKAAKFDQFFMAET